MLINSGSKLSQKVRLALIISVVCALIIAFTVFAITLLFKKKYTAKFINPKEESELAKLKLENPNYGIVLTGIKKFYTATEDDFFVAFIINSIYLNKYTNILSNTRADYLPISISTLANNCTVNILDSNLKEKKIDFVKTEIENLDEKNLKYIRQIVSDKKYDMIVSLDKTVSISNNILNFKEYLSDKGMLIINMNNLRELKEQKNAILANNFRYETIKFHHENVIILAKNENMSEIAKTN
ncbi:BC85_0335 family putative methyltransferase [Metamycoplasma equirhinis]|uniref:BC85_0335 family putative methyltransferase n=1 Tax=Metamycoplasma equirhinis TaxID=92402 RepID=UPI0035945949